MDNEKRIHIRSYNKVWKIENKIYAIQNFVLPIPIAPKELGYYGLTVFSLLLLGVLIPPVALIPWPLKFLIIPVFLTQFLLKKKLDGKAPHKYIVALIKYLIKKPMYVERFAEHQILKKEKISLNWISSKSR